MSRRPLNELHVLRPVISRGTVKRTQCDLCANLQFARCFGPCALRDVAAQMRKAASASTGEADIAADDDDAEGEEDIGVTETTTDDQSVAAS